MALLDVPRAGALSPLLAATAGVALIFAVGLFDDFVPLRARTKLLLQVVAATVIAAGGMRIDSIACRYSAAWNSASPPSRSPCSGSSAWSTR